MAEIPVLATERLLLRGHRADDFEAIHTLWSEPAVYRYTMGKPPFREQSWARLIRYAGHWTLTGFGYWAVIERATGQYIGECGFANYHRDMEPAPPADPEMGWVLSPARHGQGLGREAAGAATAWADTHLQAPQSWCMIVPENIASVRLAERLGFRAEGQGRYMDDAVTLFARPRAAS